MEHYKNLSLNDIANEVWLPIKNYETKYHISNMGRVKSLWYRRKRNKTSAILKQSLIKAGYLRVELCRRGNRFFVHRLVAEAFIPNPENKPEVNHLFGKTTDNRATELEWSTKSEQQLHAHRVLGFKPYLGGLIKGHALSRTPINKIDPITNKVLKTYDSQVKAYKELNLNKDDIYRVLKGKKLTAGNFKWEYA